MARYVRVSTISFSGGNGTVENRIQQNRQAALELSEQAANDKPDILCLPEFFNVLGCGMKDCAEHAETVPGPTTEMFGDFARRHNTYVVLGMPERKGSTVYNSAVLIDRRGHPIGSYHKMHPTIGEIEAGITPGVEAPVFETDFGRVGMAICFDLNFRDVVEDMAKKRPEIIVFSSMYRGGLQTQIWAHDFSVFFVSSITGPHSVIVNPLGRVLATSEAYNPVISRVINLDYVVCHIDYNHRRWEGLKERYGAQVELEVASPEAKFILFSHHPAVTALDMVGEFELETLETYWRRARAVREKALNNT
jgi:predicted amidohydrolase